MALASLAQEYEIKPVVLRIEQHIETQIASINTEFRIEELKESNTPIKPGPASAKDKMKAHEAFVGASVAKHQVESLLLYLSMYDTFHDMKMSKNRESTICKLSKLTSSQIAVCENVDMFSKDSLHEVQGKRIKLLEDILKNQFDQQFHCYVCKDRGFYCLALD